MDRSDKVLLTEEGVIKKKETCCSGSNKEKSCQAKTVCRDVLTCTAWVFAFQLIAFGLSFLFSGDSEWMRNLKQSKLTPPGYVFGIMWPILYTLLAVYQWYLSSNRKHHELNNLYFIAWLQMFINWSYMPVFFYLHLLVSAELVLILIVGLTGYMIVRLWLLKLYKISLLLIPYLLWCTFATYLSTVIIILN